MTTFGGYASALNNGKGVNPYVPFRSRTANWKQITTQGEVTVNLAFSHRPYLERKDAVGYYGTYNTYPNGSIEENHKLTQFEILLKETGVEGVFSSLNGYAFTDSASPADLARKLRFAGIVKSDVAPYSVKELTSSGVAVRRFGTATIPLKGLHAFYPGDRVSLYLPPFDKPERFNAGSLGFTGEPVTRLTPLLRPFDHKDIRYSHIKLLKVALGAKLANVPLDSVRQPSGERRYSALEQQALWFKSGIMAQAASGITALLRAGKLHMDPTLREELWKNIKTGKKFGEDQFNYAQAKLDHLCNPAERENYLEAELGVAEMLGMTFSTPHPLGGGGGGGGAGGGGGGGQPYMYNKKNIQLQNNIMRTVFYESLQQYDPNSVDHTHKVLDSNFNLNTLIKFSSEKHVGTNANTMIEMQSIAQNKFMESVPTSMMDVSEQIIGVSLQTANPGETPQFDLLMGGLIVLA
jgi:hypothetical protein